MLAHLNLPSPTSNLFALRSTPIVGSLQHLQGLYSPHAETRCFGRSAAETSPTPITQPFSLPPPPPRHIAKALALLQECSDVQKIVASLAADEKIWDAVMNNEKVLKYCAANRICTERTQESVNESETDVPNSPVHKGSPPPSSELGFIDFMESLKLKVREMVSSLSDLFESFMRSPRGAGSNSTAIVGITSTSNRNFEDHTAAGASFVALTIATIILLILKRGDNI